MDEQQTPLDSARDVQCDSEVGGEGGGGRGWRWWRLGKQGRPGVKVVEVEGDHGEGNDTITKKKKIVSSEKFGNFSKVSTR